MNPVLEFVDIRMEPADRRNGLRRFHAFAQAPGTFDDVTSALRNNASRLTESVFAIEDRLGE